MNHGGPDAVLQTIRAQLDQAKNRARQYQHLYRVERQENRRKTEVNNQLQARINNIEEENYNLRTDLENLENKLKLFRFPKVYKKYSELISPVGKAKRRSLFKKCIEQSLVQISEVKHATVKLRIGTKDVEIFWSENELQNLRWIGQNILDEGPANPYSDDEQDREENEKDFESDMGTNEADPFLSNGKWNPVHVRKIVHVMDLFHISMEGYHELRMASHSILPPLYVIKIHKESMSWDINFTTDHKVCT